VIPARAIGRGARVGIALSGTELCATWRAGAELSVFRTPVTAYPGDNGEWPGLVAALGELAVSMGGARGRRLAVALLPPLVEVRRLDLPPLGEAEIAQLLARSAGRYFVGARGPQTAGALVPRGRRDRQGAVLAAAAPARMLNALHTAARDAGWRVSSVVPAESAWAAAAIALWPESARRPSQLLVHEGERTALVELEQGRAANVRRFRAGDADVDLAAGAIGDAAGRGTTNSVAGFGLAGRDALRRGLSGRGIDVKGASGAWRDRAESPDVMAAAFADRTAGPWIVTEAVRAEQRVRVSRATLAVAAAAVVLFVASAGIELWGVKRDLSAVRTERSAIRSQVSATLVGRTSVEDAYRRAAALAAAERTAPHWAPVLAALSARVPDDAYLTAVHVHGDSLVVDGLATSAARVFDAIEQSADLSDVRAPAPVRRESQENSPPMERFTIAAQLNDSADGRRTPAGVARTADPRRGPQ
jgi:Fimbrial assembly protein (PilN)